MRTVCAMMRGCNARIALVLLVGITLKPMSLVTAEPSPPSPPCLSCFEVSFGLKGRVGSEDVEVGAADGCGVDSSITSYDLPTTSWRSFIMNVSDACPYIWVHNAHDHGSENLYASNLLWDGYDALSCSSLGLPDTIARTWSGWWGDCG